VPALTAEEVRERARAALEVEPTVPASAVRVHRLDVPGRSYYLVLFGRPDATTAVAAADADTGELLTWGRLSGTGPQLSLSAADAVRRAGGARGGAARLVWRPSRQSRSPLYPLWEVEAKRTHVYVDQAGTVWPRLDPGGPGGG